MADCQNILPFIKPGWIGVEIGVSWGDSAIAFLDYGCKFMYLIDPWQNYPGWDLPVDGGYHQCAARLSPYASHHAFLVMPSSEAAQYIPPVDFVWVDGNHAYEYVKSDLELYWPLIRAGGIMCGHDYTNNETCQVHRAVNEFATAHGLSIETVVPCWVIRK